MDNPEILVQAPRIVELDQIVQEVKESEEWEAVKMSILSIGIERGIEKGREEGLCEGIRAGILALLGKLGPVPESLKKEILSQEKVQVLNEWLSAAARAESIEDFERLTAAVKEK